jgi:bifunctional DNA-binding transcriptional regulator/antitoxin component of YhaV-PrlF toxin-antitoxin module
MEILDRPIEAEARLRQKNQLTLPAAIVRVLDAAPNDVIVFEADPGEPGVAHLHLVPRDFAGSLTGVYGTSEEVLEYVRGERAAWGE